ncbi:MAG TPA: 6-phosphofructokinase [Myxococcota bacterium]|nr:6-phosphofructokinase [Myxococcota bacterium]
MRSLAELDDAERADGLRRVHAGLRSLGIGGLVSIGGDGTLRTANLLHAWQARHVAPGERVRVVHVPKTIDNDYAGIDFTFGFFTAVDTLAKELLNLRADALATSSWFVVECMGRRAGWLGYGAAIAGEAHLVLGVEDVDDALSCQEEVDGELRTFLDLDRLVDRLVDLMLVREAKGKPYGTVVLTEGLVERLPPSFVASLPRDGNSMYGFAQLQLGRMVARRVVERFRARTGGERKVTGVQLGYESRCAAPHAFDVILGCQLGMGAAQALLGGQLDGVMVSASGQMELRYVPFGDLIDPATLATEVRYVRPGSDFHRLAHALGTRVPRR